MYNYLDKFINDYSYRQLLIHYTVICNLPEEYSKIYGVNFLDVVERYTDTDEISGLVEHKMLDNWQELWDLDLSNYAFAAVPEIKELGYGNHPQIFYDTLPFYCNSRTMVMNLKFIREHKMLDYLQDLERINCEAWLISAIDEAVCELLFDRGEKMNYSNPTIDYVESVIEYVRETNDYDLLDSDDEEYMIDTLARLNIFHLVPPSILITITDELYCNLIYGY